MRVTVIVFDCAGKAVDHDSPAHIHEIGPHLTA